MKPSLAHRVRNAASVSLQPDSSNPRALLCIATFAMVSH